MRSPVTFLSPLALTLLAVFLVACLVGGCSGEDPVEPGTEAQPCRDDGSCDPGLMCLSDICVSPPDGGLFEEDVIPPDDGDVAGDADSGGDDISDAEDDEDTNDIQDAGDDEDTSDAEDAGDDEDTDDLQDAGDDAGTGDSPEHPNEPAGFEPWFEHDWSWFEKIRENVSGGLAATGTGYFRTWGWTGSNDELGNYEYVEDPQGPHGYPGYMRIRVPEGQPIGSSVGSWSLSSTDADLNDDDNHVELEAAYVSFWLMYEGHPDDGTWDRSGIWRHFSVNRHISANLNSSCVRSGAEIGFSNRSRAQEHEGWQRWWLWGKFTCDNNDIDWHSVPEDVLVDTWYHVELLWERTEGGMNYPDDFEGKSRMRLWINGTLLTDHEDDHRMLRPWRQWHYNPNPSSTPWDSSGTEIKGRDDHYRITGIYISGMPN